MSTKTLIEAAQQALDAMEDFRTKVHEGRAKSIDSYDKFTIAVKDLRAAMSKPNHVEQFTRMAQAHAFQALIDKGQPL